MNLTHSFFLVGGLALMVAGCSSLPGLRVLSGEDADENTTARVVEELDLVMADKTGATDPSLLSAADRIEQATGNVDIIEIRPDAEADSFVITMLYIPPNVPDTLEGQVMLADAERRAMELSWQGVLQQSEGEDEIAVRMVYPLPITTLEGGPSFAGQVINDARISREDAAAYLTGERNLQTFYTLILDGKLTYGAPDSP